MYMNETKKLTQGAMMLAIVGALILIDRMTAYWFTELVVLIMPIVIIMYSSMHTLKDGLLLSVGLLIISFLLGNFQIIYLIYVPVGIITAMIYSYGIKKNKDKRTLLLYAVVTYMLGEILATFVIYPLLGFPVSSMLSQYLEAINQTGSMVGFDYKQMFASIGFDLNSIIVVIFVLSTLIMGAMEGVLIHILSVFLLKRFKIKDLGNTNIFEIKPNPYLAYASMFAACLFFVTRNVKIENEALSYGILIASMLGIMVLLYYGYLFVILFGVIVLHRNIGAFVVLLAFFVPVVFLLLIICGFLYGAGPLRKYLEEKVRAQQQQ